MSHRAACATGGSYLDIQSGGVCHWYLTPECPIGRLVSPVAHTWIFHRAACATGSSHMDVPSGGVCHRSLTDMSSGGTTLIFLLRTSPYGKAKHSHGCYTVETNVISRAGVHVLWTQKHCGVNRGGYYQFK
ncbi:hypothetical protein AVEN_75721-1 [Araneus ventricosus]|uniref:Uncharacterized protein n=1 Tax=Araneus ventricosus TaxID=182803 RepID=A0A4Y2K170_ARAVE|nr:hypothetical protein AVEN_75721-1 [Araneus ventricosus]